MSNEPQPQEWTPKWLRDQIPTHYSNDAASLQICQMHNAALAAAYKRGKLEGVFASPDEGEVNYVRGLEQQLAAEREERIKE
jgi:hypothetical protein